MGSDFLFFYFLHKRHSSSMLLKVLGKLTSRLSWGKQARNCSSQSRAVIVVQGAAGATCSLATRPRRATGLWRQFRFLNRFPVVFACLYAHESETSETHSTRLQDRTCGLDIWPRGGRRTTLEASKQVQEKGTLHVKHSCVFSPFLTVVHVLNSEAI